MSNRSNQKRTDNRALSFADACALGQMRKSGEIDGEVADRLRRGTAISEEIGTFAVALQTRREAQAANAIRRAEHRASSVPTEVPVAT
jgi:hypothetical protein